MLLPLVLPALLAVLHSDPVVVDAGTIRRVLEPDSRGILHTVRFEASERVMRVRGPEFSVSLSDGTQLSTILCTDATIVDPPADAALAVRYSFGDSPFSVLVVHEANPETGILRKWVRLDARLVLVEDVNEAGLGSAGYPSVETYTVEELAVDDGWSGGGVGWPLLHRDGWFAGLEHPAAVHELEAGRARLLHHPSATPGENKDSSSGDEFALSYPASVTSMWGVAAGTQPASSAFSQALGTSAAAFAPLVVGSLELLTPAGSDWTTLTADGTPILGGLPLGAILWNDPPWVGDQLWTLDENRISREQLRELGGALRRSGSSLGLPLPLTLPAETAGRIAEAASLRLVGNTLDVADATTRRLVAQRLIGCIRDGNLGYCQHRVEFPSDRPRAYEAFTGAWKKLLRGARRVEPSLITELDLGALPSPWWFDVATCVRIPLAETDSDSVPARNTVERELNLQDVSLRDWIPPRSIFPLSKLSLPGTEGLHLLQGSFAGLDQPAATERILWLLGRGSALTTALPAANPSGHLHVILKWARSRTTVMTPGGTPPQLSEWIGGDPANSEAYGYLHRRGEQQIAMLRNPSPLPSRMSLPPTSSRWIRTYPFCELIDAGTETIQLHGFEIACLETVHSIEHLREIPGSGRFEPGSREPRISTTTMFMAPGEIERFEWFDSATGTSTGKQTAAGLSPRRGYCGPDGKPQPVPGTMRWSDPGGFAFNVDGVDRKRGERWELTILVESAQHLELADLSCNAELAANRTRGDGWTLLCAELLEDPADAVLQVEWATPRPLEPGTRVRSALTWHQTLEPVVVRQSHDLRAIQRPVLPPSPHSTDRRQSFALHDAVRPVLEAAKPHK